MSNYRNAISIEIHGMTGAGKTTLMHHIGAYLQQQGLHVECFDWTHAPWLSEEERRDPLNPESHRNAAQVINGEPHAPLMQGPVLISTHLTTAQEIKQVFVRHHIADVPGRITREQGA